MQKGPSYMEIGISALEALRVWVELGYSKAEGVGVVGVSVCSGNFLAPLRHEFGFWVLWRCCIDSGRLRRVNLLSYRADEASYQCFGLRWDF
jgi:hypothetical protein